MKLQRSLAVIPTVRSTLVVFNGESVTIGLTSSCPNDCDSHFNPFGNSTLHRRYQKQKPTKTRLVKGPHAELETYPTWDGVGGRKQKVGRSQAQSARFRLDSKHSKASTTIFLLSSRNKYIKYSFAVRSNHPQKG